ncbi:MAG TPA: hypothetical protein VE523_06890 [Solirubrobacterales bacterium]|nr:hypothetical protein [Solirubrobacterales bacterium]
MGIAGALGGLVRETVYRFDLLEPHGLCPHMFIRGRLPSGRVM